MWAFYKKRHISCPQKVMDWKNWLNLLFIERRSLPTSPCIYVIADINNCVWYVGKAMNLRSRWEGKAHHRYPQLIRSNRQLNHRIYWKEVTIESLNQLEKYYIELLNPLLNGCKVKKYLPKQPQIEREIKRLLKVLNKLTMLFPTIRSLVAGEYKEESGMHCIIIIINVNDYQILSNSFRKRYATQIKKAWIDNRSYCGRSHLHYREKIIATYCLNNYKIEFVEIWKLLDYLVKNPSDIQDNVCIRELFGVQVKALKNLNILNTFPIEEEYNDLDHEGKKSLKDAAYINYRKHLLKPLPTSEEKTTERKVNHSEDVTNVSLLDQTTLSTVEKSETPQQLPLIPLLKVGERVMFMLKEPGKVFYIGFRWSDIDCAYATVKRLKETEIQFKLDSGLSITLSLKELEEIILIHPHE